MSEGATSVARSNWVEDGATVDIRAVAAVNCLEEVDVVELGGDAVDVLPVATVYVILNSEMSISQRQDHEVHLPEIIVILSVTPVWFSMTLFR